MKLWVSWKWSFKKKHMYCKYVIQQRQFHTNKVSKNSVHTWFETATSCSYVAYASHLPVHSSMQLSSCLDPIFLLILSHFQSFGRLADWKLWGSGPSNLNEYSISHSSQASGTFFFFVVLDLVLAFPLTCCTYWIICFEVGTKICASIPAYAKL